MQLLSHPNLPQTFFARIGGDYAVIKGHNIIRFRGDTAALVDMCAPVSKVIALARPNLEADIKATLSVGV